jgi:hypothetical protein
MAASTSGEDVDAMFQPRPHGAIAVDPLPTSPYDFPGDVNCLLWAATTTQDCARRKATHRFGPQALRGKQQSRASQEERPHGPATNRSPYATMSSTDADQTLQERRRVPNFFNCRRSLAASASSQSRNVTILGSVVVAFGQMIQ